MRKRGFAMLALAAAMTLGTAGIQALAAAGWVQEGGSWVYYNSAGSRVYNDWKQGSDGAWRYLDGNGRMAVSSWVDNDEYYVDENGIMLAANWLKVPDASAETGYKWYYFNQSGKNLKDEWEKIDNKWYHFGDTGALEMGWILDDMYYCGSDGVMVTGWQKLEPPESADYEDEDDEGSEDGKYWYYFSSNGKKVLPDDDGNEISLKKINGVYYCLDEYGAMQTGWVCVNGDESESIADYRYVDDNGQVRTGWYSVEPPEELRDQYDYDVVWFYFSNKGVPQVGPEKGSATYKDLEKINGNTYLFDETGVPVYGLQKVFTDEDEGEYTSYYFGTWEQSSMLKGKQMVDEGGTEHEYYFSSTGRGYTGVYEDHLYYMGRLQKADPESKYEVYTIPTSGNNYKNYVVNASGKIVKGSTVKDKGGTKYKTASSGILLEEDEEGVEGEVYTSPEEPEWDWD